MTIFQELTTPVNKSLNSLDPSNKEYINSAFLVLHVPLEAHPLTSSFVRDGQYWSKGPPFNWESLSSLPE